MNCTSIKWKSNFPHLVIKTFSFKGLTFTITTGSQVNCCCRCIIIRRCISSFFLYPATPLSITRIYPPNELSIIVLPDTVQPEPHLSLIGSGSSHSGIFSVHPLHAGGRSDDSSDMSNWSLVTNGGFLLSIMSLLLLKSLAGNFYDLECIKLIVR